jgi:hypothetical protein
VEYPNCAISFEIPLEWVHFPAQTELYPEADCSLGIRSPDWAQVVADFEVSMNEFPIYVVAYSLPPEEAARHALIFREQGKWIVTGRQGFEEEAEVVQAGEVTIVRGSAPYGLTTKDTGSYAGLGTAFRALLFEDPTYTAIVEAGYAPIAGAVSIEQAFEVIVRTLQLTK